MKIVNIILITAFLTYVGLHLKNESGKPQVKHTPQTITPQKDVAGEIRTIIQEEFKKLGQNEVNKKPEVKEEKIDPIDNEALLNELAFLHQQIKLLQDNPIVETVVIEKCDPVEVVQKRQYSCKNIQAYTQCMVDQNNNWEHKCRKTQRYIVEVGSVDAKNTKLTTDIKNGTRISRTKEFILNPSKLVPNPEYETQLCDKGKQYLMDSCSHLCN